MTHITKPVLSKFRNGEFLQFMITVLNLYNKADSKSPLLDERVKEFEQTVNIMKASFMTKTGETIIGQMRPMDVERMSVLKGLKKYLQSEYHHPDVQKKTQASVLLKSFTKFTNRLERKSYLHKTAVISSLIDHWTAKYTDAINTVGANAWMSELSTRNEKFNAQHLSKMTSKPSTAQTNKMRVDIKVVFEELLADTESFARISDEREYYIKFLKELRGIIENNERPIIKRSSRKKKEKVVQASPALPLDGLELREF